MTAAPLHGTVCAGLEPVHEVFERLLASGAETGAALCVLVGSGCTRAPAGWPGGP